MADAAHARQLTTESVDAWNAWRRENDIARVDLSGADLRGWILDGADLSGADLTDADLRGAGLRGASLIGARLIRTRLDYATLSDARLGRTVLADVDLISVLGLDTVIHEVPSPVDIGVVEQAQGRIPEAFLRGAGCSEGVVRQAQAMAEDVGKAERTLEDQIALAEEAMVAAGMLSAIPTRPTPEEMRQFHQWKPIHIDGPPVSETLLKDRR